MSDPLNLIGVTPARPALPPGAVPAPQAGAETPSFKDLLLRNLEQAGKLQQDATQAIEDLQAGRRTDVEGVLLATAKADAAFRMIQAVRNHVIRAYEEIQQMRV